MYWETNSCIYNELLDHCNSLFYGVPDHHIQNFNVSWMTVRNWSSAHLNTVMLHRSFINFADYPVWLLFCGNSADQWIPWEEWHLPLHCQRMSAKAMSWSFTFGIKQVLPNTRLFCIYQEMFVLRTNGSSLQGHLKVVLPRPTSSYIICSILSSIRLANNGTIYQMK